MQTCRPEVTGRPTGADDAEPLAVSLGKLFSASVGNTRPYELIRTGELETYHEGRARRITMRSIRERVARLTATTASPSEIPRRRGRPRKSNNTAASP